MDGWQYYKEIQISDPAGVSADYQMKLRVYKKSGTDDVANGIIYCNDLCQNFPDDIRFGTTNDPSTAEQLAQWIEEYKEGGLTDITYNSSIFGGAAQGIAMCNEYFYGIMGDGILLTKISTGRSIKAAFQYDADVNSYTDYTNEINNFTQHDVELLPTTPAVDDAFYFGLYNKFTSIYLVIDSGDEGSDITVTWEYWNGTTWTALPSVVDNTNGFTSAGELWIYWDRPADWQQSTVNGVTAYWIRARVSNVGASPVQPKASFGCSGRYTGNDAAYTTHFSDGHVLLHGGEYYLYIAGCNYPSTPKTGAIYKYKLATDSTDPLGFVGEIHNFNTAGETCPGYPSGVDLYEVNGTKYWWVTFDVTDTSSSNPSQVWRYNYNESNDADWSNRTVYNLGYYHTGYNIQGFTWWEDDYGNKYIICKIHEGSSPQTIDVYKWNGDGFDNYAQYDQLIDPDGHRTSQGVCRDFSGDNTYLYFATRLEYGRPIIKGNTIQQDEYATIWIKLPSDFSAGTNTIYMFVGNNEASLYSDGDATFIEFASFENSLEGWTDVSTGGTVSFVDSSEITPVHGSYSLKLQGTAGNKGIVELDGLNINGDVRLLYWVATPGGSQRWYTLTYDDTNLRITNVRTETTEYDGLECMSGADHVILIDAMTAYEYYRVYVEIDMSADIYNVDINNGAATASNNSFRDTGTSDIFDKITLQAADASAAGTLYVDAFCLMKGAVGNEPTWSYFGDWVSLAPPTVRRLIAQPSRFFMKQLRRRV